MREAVCVVWSRRQSRAVSAVAAGVGRGVGRAFLLVQRLRLRMQSSSARLLLVPARVARSHWRGSVVDALAVLWALACGSVGDPSCEGDRRA